jgi:L-glutamine-phosphate cytidylyltransferase
MKRAVILAAGMGTRLHGRAGDNPKCLMRLGGSTLLERQLASLNACGIRDIAVVAGFRAERVAEVCGAQASIVENTRFADTNSLYSLWLARPLLTGGSVVMNGDVLFHPQLLSDLLCDRREDALLVECRPRSPHAFGEEEMKVTVRGGCVRDIAKTLRWQEADGENVGLAKFGAAGASILARCLDDIVSNGAVREWAPRAFRQFGRVRPLHVVGTRGLPWIEIDFPEDYERAAGQVLRLIETSETPFRASADSAVALTAADGADWRPDTGHV